jgi:hypothetical protein
MDFGTPFTPAALAALVKSEIEKWTPVLQQAAN